MGKAESSLLGVCLKACIWLVIAVSTASVALCQQASQQNSQQSGQSQDASSPSQQNDSREEDAAAPLQMVTTDGVPGMFTVETAEILPPGQVAVSAGANKFARTPGSLSVLNVGFSGGVGISKHVMLYASFDPYVYLHVGKPQQLSLYEQTEFPGKFPPYAYFAPLYVVLPPWNNSVVVEDYPFAAFNTHDISALTIGLKYNFFSEQRGHRWSLAIRNDVIFPTRSATVEYARFGAQNGALDDNVMVSASKMFHGVFLSADAGNEIFRNPVVNGELAIRLPDIVRIGGGAIFRPTTRIQPIFELSDIFYQEGRLWAELGTATNNTNYGTTCPLDGIWGVRFYPWRSVGIDLAYRYALNLKAAQDRNGFVFKVGKSFSL